MNPRSFLVIACCWPILALAASGPDGQPDSASEPDLAEAIAQGERVRQSARPHALEAIRSARPIDAALAIREAILAGTPATDFGTELEFLTEPAVEAALVSAREWIAKDQPLKAQDLLARVSSVIPDDRLIHAVDEIVLPQGMEDREGLHFDGGISQSRWNELSIRLNENSENIGKLEMSTRSIADQLGRLKSSLTDVNRDLDDDFHADPLAQRLEREILDLQREIDSLRRDLDRVRSDVDRLKYR